MKFINHKNMKLNDFYPRILSNLFRKGKIMKYIKSMTTLLIAMSFAFAGCLQQESQNSDSTSDNIEQDTILSVSLGGSSRSERFLGSFDQINRLALDIDRQYGNKRVATDLELTYDNASGNWEGTVNNLIVGFDYTITGHAYRAFDNARDDFVDTYDPNGDNSTVFVEIFTGSTDHNVIDGVNTLNLRLSPILDSRTLSVPKITHIYRPFQMVASTSDNITVKVETVSKSGSNATDEDLSYRFRSVDDNSMPLNSNLGGTFSPSQDVIEHQGGGNYPDIVTTYNAPDNRSSQKIQIRVSNEQEIGITQHFTINVTDDLDVVHTVDTNPVVESFTVERISDTRLKFIVNASNDDGFSDLTYKWEYLFGDDRYFNEDTATEESSGSPRGILEAVMYDYQNTDAGMVVLTVCEDGGKTGADGNLIPDNCAFMNEASTSMSFELIPNAYQQPIICDVGNDCASEFDNSWIACDTNNGKFGSLPFAAQRISMVFGSGKGTRTEQYTTDSTCTDDSAIQITQIFDGDWTSADNVTQVKYSYDNASMVEAKRGTFTIDSVHLRIDNISLLGDLGTNICGIGNWIGQTHDVTGCDDGNFEYFDNGTVIKGIARVENDVFRWNVNDNTTSSYPDELGCNQFGLESDGDYLQPICTPPEYNWALQTDAKDSGPHAYHGALQGGGNFGQTDNGSALLLEQSNPGRVEMSNKDISFSSFNKGFTVSLELKFDATQFDMSDTYQWPFILLGKKSDGQTDWSNNINITLYHSEFSFNFKVDGIDHRIIVNKSLFAQCKLEYCTVTGSIDPYGKLSLYLNGILKGDNLNPPSNITSKIPSLSYSKLSIGGHSERNYHFYGWIRNFSLHNQTGPNQG